MIETKRQPPPFVAIVVTLVVGLSITQLRAQTPNYNQDPPPSVDDVAAGIFTGAGLSVSDLLVLVEADPEKNNWEYHLYLDSQGRPVTSDASTKRYRMEINLSYMRDGSGGHCWHCVILVADLRTKIYTNGASNDLTKEEWDDLLDGREDWEAFNDPKTNRRFNATLERNVHDAVKEALAKLNSGLTGAIRTHKLRKKKK